MSMYIERIDPSEFKMIEKSSDHAKLIEQNRSLKLSVSVFFGTLLILGIASVVYNRNVQKKADEH